MRKCHDGACHTLAKRSQEYHKRYGEGHIIHTTVTEGLSITVHTVELYRVVTGVVRWWVWMADVRFVCAIRVSVCPVCVPAPRFFLPVQ